MIVTFCGHRQVEDQAQVKKWLQEEVGELLEQGAQTFYLGGYGAFDEMAAAVLREYKRQGVPLTMWLVLAYPDGTKDAAGYDGTVYPPLETVPRRYAITRRNRWMAEMADVVVGYVLHGWGGAAAMLQYARRQKKKIFLCPACG